MSPTRVALVQLDPGVDEEENLDTAFRLVEEAEEHLDHGLAVAARERRMREEYAEEYRKLVPPEGVG